MFVLEHIFYSYNDQPFICDLNHVFKTGTVTTIIGPNGSGKSTLLKLVARQLHPASGHILLDDQDIGMFGRKSFARQVSLLAQHNSAAKTKVEDLVACGRYPYGGILSSLGKEDKNIIAWAMRQMDCERFRGKTLDNLSGGERQRVWLAMLLAQDTDVVLLDEPTTYLDISLQYEIMDLVRMLQQDLGKTVIMVLHDLSLALDYSDEMVLMQRGSIIHSGGVRNLVESGQIQEVFGVQLSVLNQAGKECYYFSKG